MTATPSRRERLRADTIAEIKAAALAQVASHGAASLSIRAVARAVGMSPAGLYRYFDGRDALLTELLSDAFGDLADAIEAAALANPHDPPRSRLKQAVAAYREWAIGNPHRFLLMFGSPVPGYAAPEGGRTVEASARMGRVFIRLGVEMWQRGEMELGDTLGPVVGAQAEATVAQIGEITPDFPVHGMRRLMGTWAAWHGMVMLEITNHLDWVYPDAQPFFEAELERILA